MSASNNCLAVLAHIRNCFSPISERIARKVPCPQCRGEKAEALHRGKSLGLTCALLRSLLNDY